MNWNPYYISHGLKGHGGWDWCCGYSSPIHSDYDFTVYKTFSKEYPGTDGFTGIFGIYDDGIQCFEWCVGHCSKVNVQVGSKVTTGDVIGEEGNFGIVYSGNQRITFQMAVNGDERGSHRHYQLRPVRKVKKTSWGGQYLYTVNGIHLDDSNNYYEIFNYNNGYNGCVDFLKPLFNRNLTVGMSGYDVWVLQRVFAKEGLFTVEPTGYFGPITLLAAQKFQKKHGIAPTLGYVGPITRTFLNTNYVVPPRSEGAGSTLPH